MINSKLIRFISHFDDTEMEQFERYLLSPYFNTNKKLVQLFGIINRSKRPYTDAALAKEKVYARLYKKTSFNNAMMRELMSDLLRAARQFVAHQQLTTDKLEATQLRYKWADAKGDITLRWYENNLAGSLLANAPVHDEYYYRHNWYYQRNKLELTLEENIGAEYKMLKDESLYQSLHALNRMYLFSFLEITIALRSLARIYNIQPDERLVGFAPALAEDYLKGTDHTLNMYWACYQLVKTNKKPFFDKLKALFFARHPKVSSTAKGNAATMLGNFCSEMMRQGQRHYLDIIIEIYREELEQGLALVNGKISYVFYQNIAGSGIETKYLDWTEEFVEKYRDYLPEEYRENAYNYGRAHVLFARGRYDEALKLALSAYNRYFFSIRLFIKNLLCRIYYELGMHQQVTDELAAYPAMLADPKMSQTRRTSFTVFCHYLAQLQALKLSHTNQSLKALALAINNENLLMHRKWFLDKLTQLQKN